MNKIHSTLLLLLAAVLLPVPRGFSCTIVAVGKKASADGSVILSHTDAGPDSRIFVVPAARHKPGAKAPVYWGIQDAWPAAAR